MSELYKSVIVSGITTMIIALGTLVWKYITISYIDNRL
jgi:hypothetical protein